MGKRKFKRIFFASDSGHDSTSFESSSSELKDTEAKRKKICRRRISSSESDSESNISEIDVYPARKWKMQRKILVSDSEDDTMSPVSNLEKHQEDQEDGRKKRCTRRISSSESETESLCHARPITCSRSQNSEYIWTTENLEPEIHNFNDENSVCKIFINSNRKILDYFQILFTEDLMAHIVKCTNEYYKSTTTSNLRAKRKYDKSWVDVTTSEVYRFFATALLMAHVKKLKYTDYWSTDCLIATESFRKIMPRDRHRAILNFLYFYDSSVANTRDPLYKIRRIIDELQRSFSRCFYPFRNLCIDESLMLFKGRLSFKQFIPAKRNRFGIKSFV